MAVTSEILHPSVWHSASHAFATFSQRISFNLVAFESVTRVVLLFPLRECRLWQPLDSCRRILILPTTMLNWDFFAVFLFWSCPPLAQFFRVLPPWLHKRKPSWLSRRERTNSAWPTYALAICGTRENTHVLKHCYINVWVPLSKDLTNRHSVTCLQQPRHWHVTVWVAILVRTIRITLRSPAFRSSWLSDWSVCSISNEIISIRLKPSRKQETMTNSL